MPSAEKMFVSERFVCSTHVYVCLMKNYFIQIYEYVVNSKNYAFSFVCCISGIMGSPYLMYLVLLSHIPHFSLYIDEVIAGNLGFSVRI